MNNPVKKIMSGIGGSGMKYKDNTVLYSVRTLVAAYLVYAVGLMIAEAVIILGSMPFGYNATDRQLPQDVMLLCSFFGYVFVIAAVILFAVKADKIGLKDIGIDKNVKTIFKGVFAGAITLSVITAILLASGFIRFNGINRDLNLTYTILFFFAYLVQSTLEEVICRGYIFHRLKKKNGTLVSAVLSILFFSVFHFPKLFEEGPVTGMIGVVNLILISVVFTLLTVYDKNIYSATGFHWIWNFMLYNVFGLNVSGIESTESVFELSAVNEFFTGSSYGIESSIITTAVTGILVIALILIGKGRTGKNGIQ